MINKKWWFNYIINVFIYKGFFLIIIKQVLVFYLKIKFDL